MRIAGVPRGRVAAFAVSAVALWLLPQAALAADVVQNGWFQSFLADFIRLQRDINRALAKGVAALRDGAGAGPVLAAMGLGFLYGAFHAIGPGHGKAVVVSYFLARDSNWLRGVWMGAQIAVFHVLSALIAVVAVHSVLKFSVTRPIDQLQSLQVISYGIIAIIGLVMLVAACRRAFGAASAGRSAAACAHDHSHAETSLLSLAVGVIPCSGAVLVLVYALANDILVSGVLMTACIAIGMALTLAAMGILTVMLRQRAVGLPGSERRSWLGTGLGLLGPAAITILGAVMLLAALFDRRPI